MSDTNQIAEAEIVDVQDVERPQGGQDPAPAPKRPARRQALAAAVVAACLIAGGGIGYAISSAASAQSAADRNAAAQEQAALAAAATAKASEAADAALDEAGKATEQRVSALEEHSHSWEPVYELKHIDARTHVAHHDAQWGVETREETMCNSCRAVVTGKTAEHTAQTGHDSFTTSVPVDYDVVTKAAWDETVVDEAARDELALTGYKCACGATEDAQGNLTAAGSQAK